MAAVRFVDCVFTENELPSSAKYHMIDRSLQMHTYPANSPSPTYRHSAAICL